MSMPPPSNPPTRSSNSERFAAALAKLAGRNQTGQPLAGPTAASGPGPDRAALATLRRGLGKPPGAVAAINQYVVPYLPPERPYGDDAYYLVAALFGWHPAAPWNRPRGRWQSNLGASFAWALGVAPKRAEGISRRFIALLNADADDLGSHLRHAARLFADHEVPVDWAQLVDDVIWWDAAGRPVQRRWARSFYAARPDGDAMTD